MQQDISGNVITEYIVCHVKIHTLYIEADSEGYGDESNSHNRMKATELN